MEERLHQEIVALTNEGEVLFEEEKYQLAIEKYLMAFDKLPDPYAEYEASSWILTAVGDSYFLLEAFQEALTNFKHAESCAGGENPFIWMRIGQCYLELENNETARAYLMRAYALEGEEIFSEDASKYLAAIADLIEQQP